MESIVSVSEAVRAYLRLRREEEAALGGLMRAIDPDYPSPPPTVEGIQDAVRAYRAARRDRIEFEFPDDMDVIDLLAFTNRWLVDVYMPDWIARCEHDREIRQAVTGSLAEAVWTNYGPVDVMEINGGAA